MTALAQAGVAQAGMQAGVAQAGMQAGVAPGALQVCSPRPGADATLACLPYAGGAASAYREWGEGLDSIEVAAVQLPGRETRIRETPHRTVEAMADEAAAVLATANPRPLVLFGHSMGAMVAFEATRILEHEYRRRVATLIVSACRAPQVSGHPPTYDLPRDEFIDHLRALGGTPRAVLESPELMELVEPLLRADLQAAETYFDSSSRSVRAPIVGFCGDRDPIAQPEEMEGWRERTTSAVPFRLELVPGDHFFLHAQHATLLARIHQHLAEATAAGPHPML